MLEIVEKRLEMALWQLECKDEDSDQKDIMLLGDAKQKLPNIKWWMPSTHRLCLHVGTPQQSVDRVARRCGYLEPGCSQFRIPMSIDDAPKKTANCPQERRGGS